uniref:Brain expressed associated with NEDD4 1 n=1 Tax=Electrophorus electricus TaxID=8005 RepID=A0AAY5EJ09_ELEEL
MYHYIFIYSSNNIHFPVFPCISSRSNQSSPIHEYPDCRDRASEPSLLVSPLVVAGIVIGLVLFLSCVTIIVGSLRKDREAHAHTHTHTHTHARICKCTHRHVCTCRHANTMFLIRNVTDWKVLGKVTQSQSLFFCFSYEECVGPAATQIYVPTDDPPPYSLTDPCHRDQLHPPHSCLEAQELPASASWLSVSGSSQHPIRLQDWIAHPVASISLSATPLEEAPPYEAVVREQSQPLPQSQLLPLLPMDLLKHTAEESTPQHPVPHTVV